MAYDPTKLEDWEIAAAAERGMPSPARWRKELGLQGDEVLPYGRIAKLDATRILRRLGDGPVGKYVEVTAITPTPLGEGKTTTTLGLIEGLARRGVRAGGAIRQPSGGPSMNIKGTAAGGGNALLIPMTEFTMGLTGDIDAITNAHNLALVALTARMHHEANYSDETLAKRGLKRLDIDPRRVELKWAIDFCAQALRQIVIGLGGKGNGIPMESGFQISVSSELMAILAIARDLRDLRARIGEMTVAHDRRGNPITCDDLEVGGAMAAWLRNALYPTLCSTVEYQPVLVHAGPFANIAVGQSSILADRLGLRLWDYHVTESGFGADIGFEKFWNVKCRLSGLVPHVSVVTATVRALKMHGGGSRVVPGRPLPREYREENLDLLERGIANLLHHLGIVRRSGVTPVVCLNRFPTDTEAELALVRRHVEGAGGRFAVGEHWRKGGEGALELADAVIEACAEASEFEFLYPLEMPLRERVERIARQVYGADGVAWSPEAEEKARAFEADPQFRDYATMMVKTHLSLSHDPDWKGVPKGWVLPIRDVLLFSGARFLCPVAGAITLMPGTGSQPAFRRVDVDPDTGQVHGLF
ncbi:MAG: Formate--tetrahydrofolate ligase [Candidatus Bipolaricaulis sibiricus]|uniref:Formate--tetrahydrofolate ligase n=1 Tax=Bipolaricaulis sibiricus TaxID=2501609 RepID=A0A410FWI4_BIPS1|nr:MAG: Formate--tetrahydrofolate ligase [Candidatus Bipolaricaulis sibiricus]